LSDSLAKKTAPLPTPSVPFFFFPFLSISETDHVWIGSPALLPVLAATRSSGA
jgi:competence transcription factor ComK